MTRIARITLFAVLFCVWSGRSAADHESCHGYGFGEEQEEEWPECWPACDGDNQSPIDVKDSDVTTEDLPHLDGPFYQERNTPFNFNITNENYTVTVQLLNAENLSLAGGPLPGRYFLHHLQFCWGSDDSMGSDHTFNGRRYPMETQWGLYNEKYASYEEASNHSGGVLRITQLHDIQNESNPSMEAIVRLLPDVVEPGQVATSDEPMTYDQIFSGFPVDDYYNYNGSFTTPPCSETVIWLIFPPGNGISEEQVAAFRQLQSTDGPLVNNFRNPQPLNGRRVSRSNKRSECDMGGCETSTSSSSARRLAGRRRQATKAGGHSRRGAAKRRGAQRRRHH